MIGNLTASLTNRPERVNAAALTTLGYRCSSGKTPRKHRLKSQCKGTTRYRSSIHTEAPKIIDGAKPPGFTVDRDLGSGYAQQWNFAVQRELTKNIVVEVAYAGSKITHVGIPGFGTITSAGDPRVLQFGLKVNF
jgi:hypothetical protein